MTFVQKQNFLIICENEYLNGRLVGLLKNLFYVSVAVHSTCSTLGDYLSEHHTDAVFMEYEQFIPQNIELLHSSMPALPILVFGNSPSYGQTRQAFLWGARDVVMLNKATTETLQRILEHALDPFYLGIEPDVYRKAQGFQIIASRGNYLSQRLLEGYPPAFYINGNRSVLMRANVICTQKSLLYQQDAAQEWIQAFGVNNCFVFHGADRELRLGAIIEQHYVNGPSFKNMLTSKVELFFHRLAALDCVCAVAYCSSDYLNYSMLCHLDSLVDQVFYLDKSKIIPDALHKTDSLLPSAICSSFHSAVSVRDLTALIDCLDRAVEHLRKETPDPDYARLQLSRLLWDFITIVGYQSPPDISFQIDNSRISAMRDSLVSIFQSALNLSEQASSPLDELIRRLEANPGLSINIDQAAEAINFSRSHFCRVFRQKTGLSFTSFLTQKRISLACTLLKKTNMDLSEVADVVGINNTWYFKKLFQKECGLSVEDWLSQAHAPACASAAQPTNEECESPQPSADSPTAPQCALE